MYSYLDSLKFSDDIFLADVSGTSEAIVDALHGLGNNEVRVNIIDSGVGDITESDIHMANISKGNILMT